MDGRDIGTVVFPNAELKLFMTASANIRAKRRYEELAVNDSNLSFQAVLDNINLRDTQDMNRSNSPLKKAPDAVLINTENMNLEEVENEILNHISIALPNSL